MLKKVVKTMALPIMLSTVLVGCSEKDEAVATVDGEEILSSELNNELKVQYGEEVLDALITTKIVELEGKKSNIKLDQKDIDAEYAEYTEMYGGEEALLEALKGYNMSKEDIVSDIKEYLMTVKVMENHIKLTDQDTKAYYEENKEQYGTPAQVEASQILVDDEATAKEMLEKLEAGGDFAALAKEFSKDTNSAQEGGALGYFAKGEKVEEFEKAAFGATINKVVGPVKSVEGFHIIRVTDKKKAVEAKYEDVKDQVYDDLLNAEVEAKFNDWLDEKYQEYEIKSKLFK